MPGPAARTTIDPLDARRDRCRRRGRTARSPEQDETDRLAPTRNVTRRGGQGRGAGGENALGGGGFFLNSPSSTRFPPRRARAAAPALPAPARAAPRGPPRPDARR